MELVARIIVRYGALIRGKSGWIAHDWAKKMVKILETISIAEDILTREANDTETRVVLDDPDKARHLLIQNLRLATNYK